jgi:hypothetical protein
VFEWLDSCRHPAFKPVLELLKRRSAAQVSEAP